MRIFKRDIPVIAAAAVSAVLILAFVAIGLYAITRVEVSAGSVDDLEDLPEFGDCFDALQCLGIARWVREDHHRHVEIYITGSVEPEDLRVWADERSMLSWGHKDLDRHTEVMDHIGGTVTPIAWGPEDLYVSGAYRGCNASWQMHCDIETKQFFAHVLKTR